VTEHEGTWYWKLTFNKYGEHVREAFPLTDMLRLLIPKSMASALFLLALLMPGSNHAPLPLSAAASSPPLECELYLAESSIPGAGVGIFSGVSKTEGEYIGNGDKAIPLVDAYWHNGFLGVSFFNPTADYVWDGVAMGMRLELFDKNDISAFWPGIDAMVNCHSGLLNLEKATPVYDEGGIHRSKHHGAGGVSPYDAGELGSYVARDIPEGGELFKSYGDGWFLGRPWLGEIPVSIHYESALKIMQKLAVEDENDDLGIRVSSIYEELVQPFKEIWGSRTMNAFYDFSWEEIKQAAAAGDIGILLQANATRSIDWLNEHGKCLDHIVHKRSTIDGAGAGAFAKRDLPKGTIVTGTPLLVFPDVKFFDMYDFQTCPDGSMARDMAKGPYSKQVMINYCFGHPDSKVALCPYGIGVNYINHDKKRANVKVQWSKDGMPGHQDKFFELPLANITDYSTKVAFDYVATRDIAEGEEIFLDYGDLWEQKFNELYEEWKKSDPEQLAYYQTATEFNKVHANDYLLTPKELEPENPYPDNLSLRCHYLLDDYETAFDGDPSEVFSDWHYWNGDNTGYPCEVLERSADHLSYVVRYVTTVEDNAEPRTISNVPREAIKFFDNPYTTDLHMVGAFRQPLGIPDELLPEAWRRSEEDDNDEKTAYIETLEEACARNPYRVDVDDEYEYEGHHRSSRNRQSRSRG